MVGVPTTRPTETADEPQHIPTTTTTTAATAFPTNLPLMLSNRQGGLKLGATQKRLMTPKDGRDKEKCPGSNRAQKDGRRKKKNKREKMPDSRSAHTESPRMLCEV